MAAQPLKVPTMWIQGLWDQEDMWCDMERGEKEVGIEILLKISREYGKSLEWLLLGNG
jgi:hypothetical protein